VRPSKDGQPLPEELVTISRGGKRVVTVRRPPAPPDAAVTQTDKGAPAAFVVLNPRGARQAAYASLAAAIAGSSSGDTIEIRGNGPFRTAPLSIATARTIRAGDGYQPVIRIETSESASRLAALHASGPLTLEGLNFEHSIRGAAAVFGKGPLHVANCRFTHCHLATDRSPFVHLRNCQFSTPLGSSVRIAASTRVTLQNNVSIAVAGFAALSLTIPADIADCRLTLARNTLMGGAAISLLTPVGTHSREGQRVQMHVEQNVLVGLGSAVHCNVVSDSPTALLPQEWRTARRIERHLRELVVWREERNAYGDGAPLLGLSVGPAQSAKMVPTTRPIRSPAAWNAFWGQADAHSVQGAVRLQGGDLFAKTELMSARLVPGDFRLSEDSAGIREGADPGPLLELVGPGPAYDRWKNTPAYEQWKNEITQQP
jgi:hypothetical protein